MIKEANISEIENLNFNQLDPRDLEESLDHENFNFKIQQLYYDEKDCELLSEVSLNNICKIKPRQLHLSRLISMSHLIMILSNIHEDIIINFQCSSSDELSLKFSNTIAYFKDKKDILKIFCNLICFKLSNRDKNEIIFYDKQNIAVSLCETMRIKSITKEINSTNFTVENDSSFNLIKDDFCILPISGLREICLSIEQLQEILENEINKIYVPELLPSIKIVISLQSTNDVVKFDELSMHLPKHCELKIRDIYRILSFLLNKFKII